ncbi:PREDICTED: matrix-remodeling-associated protein 7 isoform X2 [Nanorana parkeri]|uniref:matrix-remodeling-associated protein 7 isoform X2 n=1 Tax=Nanorana parkeri TaxID=125878 RepID=UPI000854990C|nr:PREDICTED: matrix-remodeling-associated protein 7 isoform X2 [Nanorana parkeri]
MELEGDFSLTVPLIFTALAVILATLWVKLRSTGEKQPAEESHEAEVKERVTETLEEERDDKEDHAAEEEVPERTVTETAPVEEVGAAEKLPAAKESEMDATECEEKATTPSSQSSQEEEEEDSKEEDVETENDKVLKISEADDADDEDFSFKYLPGKLRGSDYENMLTKDELEEEQRTEDDKKLTLQSS